MKRSQNVHCGALWFVLWKKPAIFCGKQYALEEIKGRGSASPLSLNNLLTDASK